MNLGELIWQLIDLQTNGGVAKETEVVLTSLEAEHNVHHVEVQNLSGTDVISIQTDEAY